jgi:hypothetical protein
LEQKDCEFYRPLLLQTASAWCMIGMFSNT